MASLRTENFIRDLNVRPEIGARYHSERETLFEEFQIPEDEREAMREATPPALNRIGLHPVLQIHYFIGTKHPAARHLDGGLLSRLGGK